MTATAMPPKPRKKELPPIVQIRPLYLARPDAAAFLALSESTLDALVSRGDAPKPRKLSKGRTAWLVDDLESWGRERPVSDLLPPQNSGYGRAGAPEKH
ncbi:AlpA family phage regulatory protein [Variovorax sp. J22P168]|uniref:helix-turn-helix transcriptional regulator n=1 Tax=Variovorax jilinensis TaxID=3053513 RepID=UPI00257743E2|nr:AlpA family phage regulatory protein [Variovorax sp. J22P168]MDM0011964.1 AlpA family phage regulatory protein [Variovorax sp. J22P168]